RQGSRGPYCHVHIPHGRDRDHRPPGRGAGDPGPVIRGPVMRPIRSSLSAAGTLLALTALLTPSPAAARGKTSAPAAAPVSSSLQEVGHAFELARGLGGDQRLAALQQTDQSLASL